MFEYSIKLLFILRLKDLKVVDEVGYEEDLKDMVRREKDAKVIIIFVRKMLHTLKSSLPLRV